MKKDLNDLETKMEDLQKEKDRQDEKLQQEANAKE